MDSPQQSEQISSLLMRMHSLIEELNQKDIEIDKLKLLLESQQTQPKNQQTNGWIQNRCEASIQTVTMVDYESQTILNREIKLNGVLHSNTNMCKTIDKSSTNEQQFSYRDKYDKLISQLEDYRLKQYKYELRAKLLQNKERLMNIVNDRENNALHGVAGPISQLKDLNVTELSCSVGNVNHKANVSIQTNSPYQSKYKKNNSPCINIGTQNSHQQQLISLKKRYQSQLVDYQMQLSKAKSEIVEYQLKEQKYAEDKGRKQLLNNPKGYSKLSGNIDNNNIQDSSSSYNKNMNQQMYQNNGSKDSYSPIQTTKPQTDSYNNNHTKNIANLTVDEQHGSLLLTNYMARQRHSTHIPVSYVPFKPVDQWSQSNQSKGYSYQSYQYDIKHNSSPTLMENSIGTAASSISSHSVTDHTDCRNLIEKLITERHRLERQLHVALAETKAINIQNIALMNSHQMLYQNISNNSNNITLKQHQSQLAQLKQHYLEQIDLQKSKYESLQYQQEEEKAMHRKASQLLDRQQNIAQRNFKDATRIEEKGRSVKRESNKEMEKKYCINNQLWTINETYQEDKSNYNRIDRIDRMDRADNISNNYSPIEQTISNSVSQLYLLLQSQIPFNLLKPFNRYVRLAESERTNFERDIQEKFRMECSRYEEQIGNVMQRYQTKLKHYESVLEKYSHNTVVGDRKESLNGMGIVQISTNQSTIVSQSLERTTTQASKTKTIIYYEEILKQEAQRYERLQVKCHQLQKTLEATKQQLTQIQQVIEEIEDENYKLSQSLRKAQQELSASNDNNYKRLAQQKTISSSYSNHDYYGMNSKQFQVEFYRKQRQLFELNHQLKRRTDDYQAQIDQLKVENHMHRQRIATLLDQIQSKEFLNGVINNGLRGSRLHLSESIQFHQDLPYEETKLTNQFSIKGDIGSLLDSWSKQTYTDRQD